MESPARNQPSLYGSKTRGMLNSARNWNKSKQEIELSPRINNSEMKDTRNDDVYDPAISRDDLRKFNKYLRDKESNASFKKKRLSSKNLSSLGNILSKSLADP